MPELSPKVRDSVYLGMFLVNAVLLACMQQDVLPAAYSHYALMASLVLATVMKQFGAKEPEDQAK